MIIFYDHLLPWDELDAELARRELSDDERRELLRILDASLHHTAFNVIFQGLPNNLHETFLVRFLEDPASGDHLPYLRQHLPHIEDELRLAGERAKIQFIDAIHD